MAAWYRGSILLQLRKIGQLFKLLFSHRAPSLSPLSFPCYTLALSPPDSLSLVCPRNITHAFLYCHSDLRFPIHYSLSLSHTCLVYISLSLLLYFFSLSLFLTDFVVESCPSSVLREGVRRNIVKNKKSQTLMKVQVQNFDWSGLTLIWVSPTSGRFFWSISERFLDISGARVHRR
jgi:hypothetical protein